MNKLKSFIISLIVLGIVLAIGIAVVMYAVYGEIDPLSFWATFGLSYLASAVLTIIGWVLSLLKS